MRDLRAYQQCRACPITIATMRDYGVIVQFVMIVSGRLVSAFVESRSKVHMKSILQKIQVANRTQT